MNDLLEIGVIVAPHGLKGEVSLVPWCDDYSVFSLIDSLFDKNSNKISVLSVRYKKNNVILGLDCCSNRNEAEKLRGKIMSVRRSDLPPLEQGTYYIADILGAQVTSSCGVNIGTIDDFIETGANLVYVVKTTEGKEVLIPDIPDVICSVDIENKIITINLIEGLL